MNTTFGDGLRKLRLYWLSVRRQLLALVSPWATPTRAPSASPFARSPAKHPYSFAEISRDDVRVIDWPTSAVPANAISDPQEVVGRGIIMPMIQNEPFLPLKLSSKDGGGGLPPAIPPGLRAVSVKVNEVIGVAGYVLPGTRVDVVATISPTQQPTDMTSKVILTNVQVLAAGTKIERDTERNKPIAVGRSCVGSV